MTHSREHTISTKYYKFQNYCRIHNYLTERLKAIIALWKESDEVLRYAFETDMPTERWNDAMQQTA